MKIYTKTGDKGNTGLIGGSRVGKDSLRICAYGEIDELNSVLGLCREENDEPGIERILHSLQKELFVLGADMAAPYGGAMKKIRRISASHVKKLEKKIDKLDTGLPALKNFILPAGTDAACFLHLARTVCRRAERTVVALSREEKINPNAVVYLNRMGDLLFVMARTTNRSAEVKEENI